MKSLFWSSVGIAMIPASILVPLAAMVMYIWIAVDEFSNGETVAGIMWLLIWGHFLSALAMFVVIGLPLFVLSLLIGGMVCGVAGAFRLQMTAIRTFPFGVHKRKEESDDYSGH